jgi:hypothetical protein
MNIFKYSFVVMICCQLLWSCTDKKKVLLTPAQKQARLDSILSIQQQEIIEMEAELLRDRMSIEVKEKTDSILAARSKNSVKLPLSLPDTISRIDTLAAEKDTIKSAP